MTGDTMHQFTIAALLALCTTLAGCGTLKPETITGAVIAHADFPTLSIAVSDCLADRPDVRDAVTPAWNRIVDKWSAADDLPRDARLVGALVNAQAQVDEAARDWTFIRRTVVASGVDCGPAVAAMVANVEKTFSELQAAIQGNATAVYVLEWASLLSTVVRGNGGGVVRLPT